MLARAARRPAQWRTTRTQTAHPSTTQVKMPQTTCALATCRPPENCAPYPSARSTPSVNAGKPATSARSEEHTSELQSQSNLVCRLLLEKKKKKVLHG